MKRPPKARIGLAGYASLLAALKAEPGTIAQLQDRLQWGKDTLYKLVPALHSRGLLHIVGWHERPHASMVAVYAYGQGQDAPVPAKRSNGRPGFGRVLAPEKIPAEALAFSIVIRELAEPSTSRDLTELSGVHRATLSKILAVLRRHGMARIVAWTPRDTCGGKYIASWQLGRGADAAYPSRERMRKRTAANWRQRSKAAEPFLALHSAFAANDARQAA